MSYATVRDYLVKRLINNGFHEAKTKTDISNEGDNFNNLFMLTQPEVEEEKETHADRFHMDRRMNVRLFKKFSENGQIIEYDSFQMQIDNVIADIPNPANYQGDGIRIIKYDGHITEEAEHYWTADVSFLVEDKVIYA